MAKNENIEVAINEHLIQKLQEDLNPDQSHALQVKVGVIRKLASE